VINTTGHSITLDPRVIHRDVIPKAVYPAAIQPVTQEQTQGHPDQVVQKETKYQDTTISNVSFAEVWDPPIALDHLTRDQQTMMREMLRKECKAFAKDDSDVGCIPSPRMHISLRDPTPVQKTYISVPKPLHQEVKNLLTRPNKQGLD